MAFGNQLAVGCCCGTGPGGGGCDTGSIKVLARQNCDATSVVGATVTVTRGAFVVTGTTTRDGFTATGLVPGVYRITVTFDGVTKDFEPLGVEVPADCAPVTVTTATSFGQTFFDATFIGCNGTGIPGGTFQVFQSGVLLATGTSGSTAVRADFSSRSNGTNLTITFSHPPEFLDTTFIAAPTCSFTGDMRPHINSEPPGGYSDCCSGAPNRTLPYGPTVECSVGGHAATLTWAGAGLGNFFFGTITATVPGWTPDCFLGSVAGTVTACFDIQYVCSTLTVRYLGCVGGAADGKPLASDCGSGRNITRTGTATLISADPLAVSGTIVCPLGNTWSVTESP